MKPLKKWIARLVVLIVSIGIASVMAYFVLSEVAVKSIGNRDTSERRNLWWGMTAEQEINFQNTLRVNLYLIPTYSDESSDAGVNITIYNGKTSVERFVPLRNLKPDTFNTIKIFDWKLLSMDGTVRVSIEAVGLDENNYVQILDSNENKTNLDLPYMNINVDEGGDKYLTLSYSRYSIYIYWGCVASLTLLVCFVIFRYTIIIKEKIFGHLVKDVKRYFKYTIVAAKAELNAEVTNSYLDWFWWVLEPVCNMLIYYFIFGYVFKLTEEYFLVFIFSGITIWNFFSKCVTSSVRLILDNKAIITRVYIPKNILLIQKTFVNLFKMGISSIIVALLMIPYRITVDWHLVQLIPIFLVIYIFTYGCGCVLMHYGVYVDDLSYIVSIVLNMLFYFTGIFYSIQGKFPVPLGDIFETVDPVAFFITLTRNALLYESTIDWLKLLVWLVLSVLLALEGTRLIYKNENSYVKVI